MAGVFSALAGLIFFGAGIALMAPDGNVQSALNLQSTLMIACLATAIVLFSLTAVNRRLGRIERKLKEYRPLERVARDS
ncbi:MAG: hypothetical protein EOP83_03505 [Verrucomicrobiaceae bacterium]|nr:MAG: hypothetical protein EOP83_03505 [Verrucomicrobiaceae bacterium]